MKPRLFYAVSPIAAVMIAWTLHTFAPVSAEQARQGTEGGTSVASTASSPPVEIQGSDWTWTVGRDGTIVVSCKGAVVLDTKYPNWGAKWSWAGSKTEYRPGEDGVGVVTGTIPNFKTEISGVIRALKPNVVQLDLKWTSAETIPEVIGGGMSWATKTQAAVFGGRTADPTFLPDKKGWTWTPAPGQTITLETSPAAAGLHFEKGVRMYFLKDRIDRGVKEYRLTLTLPEGATRALSPEERYDPVQADHWYAGALAWNASPIDLRFLNAHDRPAGGRGPIRASGDGLVLGDGTPARFWGANLVANAIFSTPREQVPVQAERMAKLGYNLMRIHHHDSPWVNPNIFGPKGSPTISLNPESLEKLDYWIKCLKDEGIYVWIDLYVSRRFQDADGFTEGLEEVAGNEGRLAGFSYFNKQIQQRMREFQEAYLSHVNEYTGLAYKDDPAVAAVLLVNENDVTHHYGNMFLPTSKRPYHSDIYSREAKAFAAAHGLPPDKVWRAWEGGPSKLFLNDVEHRFNQMMLSSLQGLGYKGLVATTNYWGDSPMLSVASLTDGGLIDVHAYGSAESLGANPRYVPNYLATIATAHVSGLPLTISEWNVPYPAVDRFVSPLYTAAVASLQGWDAPMLYNYSHNRMVGPPKSPDVWSTFNDPALTGVMPAAALLFRRGHVSPAVKTYHLAMPSSQFFGRLLSPKTSATVRTLVEQSRLTIGIPETPELPWLKPSPTPPGAIVLDDPDRDMLAPNADSIQSDTGELRRDWTRGVQVVDSPMSQAVSGWIDGESIATTDARFEIRTKKAVASLNSVDDLPLSKSRFILITTIARAVSDPNKKTAFLSEPVVGSIVLKTEVEDLELLALAADGRVAGRSRPRTTSDGLRIDFPTAGGTHWYVLKSRTPAPDEP